MSVEIVRHADSQGGASEGHQTVTGAWAHDLVPDRRGATERPEPGCPVEVALAAVSGRWTTLVLRELMHGPRSFGDLRSALPDLSAKVLSERLATLADQGLIGRERSRTFPARTLYRLTPAGTQVRPLLVELYRTGDALLRARA